MVYIHHFSVEKMQGVKVTNVNFASFRPITRKTNKKSQKIITKNAKNAKNQDITSLSGKVKRQNGK